MSKAAEWCLEDGMRFRTTSVNREPCPALRRATSVAVAGLIALIVTAGPANAAPLTRGLEQLVRMYEVNSSRLAGVLRLHVTAPGGDPLVEIKLVDGLTTADVLPALTRAGFRVQAISELDPSLLEGYAPLSAVRGVAAVTGVKVVRAVQRPHANAGSVQS